MHPRMRTAIEIAWPSLCTIQTIDTIAGFSNQPVPQGTGTNVAGMVEIPCRLSPMFRERPTDDIQRGGAVQEYHTRRDLLLNGDYHTILPDTMQAVVDGIVYPIRGLDADGNAFITRLKLEMVRPHG